SMSPSVCASAGSAAHRSTANPCRIGVGFAVRAMAGIFSGSPVRYRVRGSGFLAGVIHVRARLAALAFDVGVVHQHALALGVVLVDAAAVDELLVGLAQALALLGLRRRELGRIVGFLRRLARVLAALLEL